MTKLACALMLLSSAAFAKRDAWVVIRDENSVSMSGSTDDLALARRHLRELGPGYLWFRHDGGEYVVKDGAALREINELADRQAELGAEQGRLGKAQGDLGRQQGEIGREQGQLGRQQARRALDEDRHRARDDGDDESGSVQHELGRAQSTLGREQARMGREQAKMGARQEKLSRQMQAKIERLIEQSLKDGTAKPI